MSSVSLWPCGGNERRAPTCPVQTGALRPSHRIVRRPSARKPLCSRSSDWFGACNLQPRTSRRIPEGQRQVSDWSAWRLAQSDEWRADLLASPPSQRRNRHAQPFRRFCGGQKLAVVNRIGHHQLPVITIGYCFTSKVVCEVMRAFLFAADRLTCSRRFRLYSGSS